MRCTITWNHRDGKIRPNNWHLLQVGGCNGGHERDIHRHFSSNIHNERGSLRGVLKAVLRNQSWGNTINNWRTHPCVGSSVNFDQTCPPGNSSVGSCNRARLWTSPETTAYLSCGYLEIGALLTASSLQGCHQNRHHFLLLTMCSYTGTWL